MLKRGTSLLLRIDKTDGSQDIIEKMILKMLYLEKSDTRETFAPFSRKKIEEIIRKPHKTNKFFSVPLFSGQERKIFDKKMGRKPSRTTFQEAFEKLEIKGLIERHGKEGRSVLYRLADKGILLIQGSERDEIMTHGAPRGTFTYLEFCPEIVGLIDVGFREPSTFKQIMSLIGGFGFPLGWDGTTRFVGRIGFACDHELELPKRARDKLIDVVYSYLNKLQPEGALQEIKEPIDGTIRFDFDLFKPLNPAWYIEQGKLYRQYAQANQNERPEIEAKIKKRVIEQPYCLDHIYSLMQLAAIFLIHRKPKFKQSILDELREARRLLYAYQKTSNTHQREYIRNWLIQTFLRTYVYTLVDKAKKLKQEFEYVEEQIGSTKASPRIIKLFAHFVFEWIGSLKSSRTIGHENLERTQELMRMRKSIYNDRKTWKMIEKIVDDFQTYCEYLQKKYGLSTD